MIVLLGVLATLQYRWIGEVSSAERDRLRATAITAAETVAADFDADITRVVHHLGIPPGEIDPGRYLSRSAGTWAANVQNPEIVQGVYLAVRDLPDRPASLARVDLASGRTEPVEWPLPLSGVRAAIERSSQPPGDRNPRFPERPATAGALFRRPGVEIFDQVPALVIPPPPMPHMPHPDPDPGAHSHPEPAPSPWVVVQFDRHALVDVFLGRLVSREFGKAGELDVAVIRRGKPDDVVFRSRAGFAPASARAFDAEAPLFTIRPGGPAVGEPPMRMRRRESFGRAGGSGAWTLVAAHRSVTLQEAVDASRRRNLLVSSGILLLLAGSVATLLFSVHRAQRLAHQQFEFVAGITHELRTPLAAIRSAGQNLADGVVSDPERVRSYGSLVVREGRRLSGLIEGALDHAGIAARREARDFEAVSFSRVLGEAVAACRPLAAENESVLERDVPPDLPPIQGDESELRTLFENLVSNALKYGGRRGRVEIRARAKEDRIEVSVSDSGNGISPHDLPHIFEPFFRGAEVSSGVITGSGLGLSLVRRIAESHGGSVRVESPAGGGAIFHVSLPAAAAETGAPEEATS